MGPEYAGRYSEMAALLSCIYYNNIPPAGRNGMELYTSVQWSIKDLKKTIMKVKVSCLVGSLGQRPNA